MKAHGNIQLTVWLSGLAGAAIFTGLLVHQGASDVMTVVAAAGWGLAAVAACHLIPLFMDTLAWHVLFPKRDRLHLRRLYWMRWIGESVSNLVPSAQIGGDFVRARLAAMYGPPFSLTAATATADITISIFAQIGVTLTGISLLVSMTGQTKLERPALTGALVAILAVAGFYAVQRLGMFRGIAMILSRLAGESDWKPLVENGEAFDQNVRSIYGRLGDVGISFCCTVISWAAASIEVWIALYAVGAAASYVDALILESVSQGFRMVMFFIPGGLGVQEGGYLFVGSLLGIPGDTALALALIRRVRELTIGIPALIVWQLIEGLHLWQRNTPEVRVSH